MAKLTSKQEKFCQEIVKGKSQADAYKIAFKPQKATKKSIIERGCQIMADINIQSRIKEIRGPVIEAVQWSLADRMKELSYAGKLDPLDIYDEHGMPKAMKDIPVHARRAISGWEIDPEKFTTKIKTVDKRGAIMDYTRLAGDMPSEKVEVKGIFTVEHLLELVYKKDPKVING